MASSTCELILKRGPCAGQPRLQEGTWFSFGNRIRPSKAQTASQLVCRRQLQAWQKTCGATALLGMRILRHAAVNGRAGAAHSELIARVLHMEGLSSHAVTLVSHGHTVDKLRQLPRAQLDLIAAGQLGLDSDGRRKFVSAFGDCYSSAPPKRRQSRAACIASTLSVAPVGEWQKKLAWLSETVDATVVVTPTPLSSSTAVQLLSTSLRNVSLVQHRTPHDCVTRQCKRSKSEGPHFWVAASLKMKQQCWLHFEEVERRRQVAFGTFLYLRADDQFAFHANFNALLHAAEQILRRTCHAVPCVFTPDSWPWLGVNDRQAVTNRLAAQSFFSGPSEYFSRHIKVRSERWIAAEKILGRALNESHVRVLTYPTLSALTCCSRERTSCWNRQCSHLCDGARLTLSRYKIRAEAERAASNAAALRDGSSCLASCREGAGLCLRPAPPLPWGKDARPLSSQPFFWVSPNESSCRTASTRYARPPTSEVWTWDSAR